MSALSLFHFDVFLYIIFMKRFSKYLFYFLGIGTLISALILLSYVFALCTRGGRRVTIIQHSNDYYFMTGGEGCGEHFRDYWIGIRSYNGKPDRVKIYAPLRNASFWKTYIQRGKVTADGYYRFTNGKLVTAEDIWTNPEKYQYEKAPEVYAAEWLLKQGLWKIWVIGFVGLAIFYSLKLCSPVSQKLIDLDNYIANLDRNLLSRFYWKIQASTIEIDKSYILFRNKNYGDYTWYRDSGPIDHKLVHEIIPQNQFKALFTAIFDSVDISKLRELTI